MTKKRAHFYTGNTPAVHHTFLPPCRPLLYQLNHSHSQCSRAVWSTTTHQSEDPSAGCTARGSAAPPEPAHIDRTTKSVNKVLLGWDKAEDQVIRQPQ